MSQLSTFDKGIENTDRIRHGTNTAYTNTVTSNVEGYDRHLTLYINASESQVKHVFIVAQKRKR